MSTWQRISGLIEAPDSQVQRARGFLEGAKVVARLEFDPQEQASAWVCVAVDADNHVAVLADDGASLIPGPPVQELALALAQECQGSVTFDRETTNAEPDGEPADEDPFDPQIGIVVVAERAVVRAAVDLENLEELATQAQRTLLAAPDEHGYVLLFEDGPAVGEIPLAAVGHPVVVLQHAADYPALSVVNGAEEYQHVWGLDAELIPSGSPAAQEFADATLGLGLLAALVSAAVPGVPAAQARAAVADSADAPGAVAALGLGDQLSEQVRQFLLGDLQGSDVDGAVEIEPLSAGEHVRRRAQEAADEARRAAGNAADDVRRRADEVWRWGEDAAQYATSPSDSAEEMVRQGVPYMAAGAQFLLGGLLWRVSGRARRQGRPMGGGAKAVRGVSVLLWAAAGANVSVALQFRLRRRTQS